jgi:hypothetical protein
MWETFDILEEVVHHTRKTKLISVLSHNAFYHDTLHVLALCQLTLNNSKENQRIFTVQTTVICRRLDCSMCTNTRIKLFFQSLFPP